MAELEAQQEIIGPEMSQGVPTRELVIEIIKNATSLEELFDVANKALGSSRQAWGDDLAQSAVAAKVWGACSFPIHAAEKVSFTGTFTNKVSGADYCQAGLEAAKAAAVELLSPLPPASSGGAPDELDAALLRARRATLNVRSPLALSGKITGTADFTRMLDGAALIGPYGWYKMESSAQELRAESQSEPISWEAVDKHLGGSQSTPGSGQDERQKSEPFRDLVDEVGFEIVNVGPLGGMSSASAGARQILTACRDLAAAAGAPSVRVASLGGLGIYANCDQDNAEASFLTTRFALSFGANPASLGHEWTHAFEAMVKRQVPGDPLVLNSAEALGKMEALIQSGLPNDASALREARDGLSRNLKSKTTQVIERFLASSGTEPCASDPEARAQKVRELVDGLHESGEREAHQWVESRGGGHAVVSGPPLVSGAPWMGASREKGLGEFMDKLVKLTRDGQPELDPQGVAAHFDEAREACRRQAVLDLCTVGSSSSFEAGSKFLNLIGSSDKEGYWTEKMEVLARAAEGFYLQGSARGALVNDPQGITGLLSLPHGAEREALGKAYGQWMEASMPWLAKVCGFEQVAPAPIEAHRPVRTPEPQQVQEASALAAFGQAVDWAKNLALDAVSFAASTVSTVVGIDFADKLRARRGPGSPAPSAPGVSSKVSGPGI